jgi:hypothetical protein
MFPDVMADARKRLFVRSREFLADWLRQKASERDSSIERDIQAITLIWLGAIENYWILTNLQDEHPFGIDDDRFIRQWVGTLMVAIGAQG